MKNRTRYHAPYNKLKGALREKGLTYSDVSELLKISETAVSHKINGYSDFFIREVDAIENEYDIPYQFFLKEKLRI